MGTERLSDAQVKDVHSMPQLRAIIEECLARGGDLAAKEALYRGTLVELDEHKRSLAMATENLATAEKAGTDLSEALIRAGEKIADLQERAEARCGCRTCSSLPKAFLDTAWPQQPLTSTVGCTCVLCWHLNDQDAELAILRRALEALSNVTVDVKIGWCQELADARKLLSTPHPGASRLKELEEENAKLKDDERDITSGFVAMLRESLGPPQRKVFDGVESFESTIQVMCRVVAERDNLHTAAQKAATALTGLLSIMESEGWSVAAAHSALASLATIGIQPEGDQSEDESEDET